MINARLNKFQTICFFQIGILVFTLLISTQSSLADSPEKKFSCHFYEGEDSAHQLQLREEILLNKERPFPGKNNQDYCELAHINYRLAKKEGFPKKQLLERCITFSQKAINENSKSGLSYFLKGLCLGKLGEMKGIWASLQIINPFKENMKKAMLLSPKVDQGGPHRALGKMYYELPFFLGGSISKSIYHLEQAVTLGPLYWENHYFLGQSYIKKGRYQEAQQALTKAKNLHPSDNNSYKKNTQLAEINGLIKSIEPHIQ